MTDPGQHARQRRHLRPDQRVAFGNGLPCCRADDQRVALDANARKKAWAAFGADADWAAAKAASEIDGPLLKSQVISVLSPVGASLLLN